MPTYPTEVLVKITNNEREEPVEEVPAATPFLFIPQSSDDTGTLRPLPAGVGWIDSPSVFLLSDDGRIEVVPRGGVKYRVVVLTGNAGTVPAENCYAEFYLDFSPRSLDSRNVYEKSLAQSSQHARWLGVSSFSTMQSKAGSALSWAISPGSWTVGGGFLNCFRIRVYDLLHDSPAADYNSVTDRKVALRVFRPNFAGVWSGNEFDAAGGLLGHVRLTINQDWTLNDAGDHVPIPKCTIVVDEFPSLLDRRALLSEAQEYPAFGGSISFAFFDKDLTSNFWSAYCVPIEGDVLKVSLRKQADADDVHRSEVVLYRDGPAPATPGPNTSLLKRVSQSISTYWPPSRKYDAKILYRAINSLSPP